MLELDTEYTIYYRKDTKKAIYYLKTIKDSLSKEKISGFKRALRWHLLMLDLSKLLNDSEATAHYLRQSNIIKNQLRVIGVLEHD